MIEMLKKSTPDIIKPYKYVSILFVTYRIMESQWCCSLLITLWTLKRKRLVGFWNSILWKMEIYGRKWTFWSLTLGFGGTEMILGKGMSAMNSKHKPDQFVTLHYFFFTIQIFLKKSIWWLPFFKKKFSKKNMSCNKCKMKTRYWLWQYGEGKRTGEIEG